jgi:pimeloyl-ACP methyl ester carboxylesterase
MDTVTSRDGTRIAYEKMGAGPAVILVDGALCHRGFGPARPLAEQLKEHFTVYIYDRRGRGDSDDPSASAESPQREVDDLEALIKEAGGAVGLYGISSGGALALEAADRLPGVEKLAIYEVPFVVDDSKPPIPGGYVASLETSIAAGKPGDAVKSFMKLVGAPGFAIMMMRLMPVWKKLSAVGHTLPDDLRLLHGDGTPLPAGRWPNATQPTLAMDGGKSPQPMRNAMAAIAANLPDATYRTLPGQTHMLKAGAVAPILIEFFGN